MARAGCPAIPGRVDGRQRKHWPLPLTKIRRSGQAQTCEANFYGGELALLKKNKPEATRMFKPASNDCPLELHRINGRQPSRNSFLSVRDRWKRQDCRPTPNRRLPWKGGLRQTTASRAYPWLLEMWPSG